MRAFQPNPNATKSIGVSSSSQPLKITDATTTQVEVYNGTTGTIFIAFGNSTITTTTADGQPIPPGAMPCYSVDSQDGGSIYVAVIATTATGSAYFTPGAGL